MLLFIGHASLIPVFVPDTSTTRAWFFEDKTSEWTEALLTRLKPGNSTNTWLKCGAR